MNKRKKLMSSYINITQVRVYSVNTLRHKKKYLISLDKVCVLECSLSFMDQVIISNPGMTFILSIPNVTIVTRVTMVSCHSNEIEEWL